MKLQIIKPSSTAEKFTKTTVDTIELTPQLIEQLPLAPFQRPLRVNAKVEALATEIAQSGVIPGVLTIGVDGTKRYLVDGQHRVEAFRLSGRDSAYADVRTVFGDIGAMAEEFVQINSRLVTMRPDDVLRGLAETFEPLRSLRKACPFVGYDMIRRSQNAPLLSMSLVLRMWRSGSCETPAGAGPGAAELGRTLTMEQVGEMSAFLKLCFEAWGRDPQYLRLWASLNLTLCAWLYRRLVITQHSPKTPRLSGDQFRKCLMALSADEPLLDWLVNRQLGRMNTAPAYRRIKAIFVARLTSELGRKPMLPQPAWAAE